MEKIDSVIVNVEGNDVDNIVVRATKLPYKETSKKAGGFYDIVSFAGTNFILDSSHPFLDDLKNGRVQRASLETFKDEEGKTRIDYAGHTTFESAMNRLKNQVAVAKAGATLKAIETAALTPETVQAILSTSAGF